MATQIKGLPVWRVGRVGVAVLVAIVLAHIGTLWLPFVNQETAFNSAVTYFLTGDVRAVQTFFDADANTLVLPALGAGLAGVLGLNADWGCRLLSWISFAVIAAALYSMASEKRGGWLVAAAIMLNPLVWVFAGRGTADFSPMALAVAGIAMCWRAKGNDMVIAGAVLFALGAVMKYHAVLLLPFIALAPDQSLRFRAIMFSMVAAVAGIALIAHNFTVFTAFGFWITSPKWAAEHGPTAQNILINFVQYGGYLALLAMPFSVQAAFGGTTGRMTKVGVVLAATIVGLMLPASTGEMNFGPFDRWIGTGFSTAVLAGMFAVFVMSLLGQERGMQAAVIFFILVLSFSRPAQRYLILILPFYVIFLSARIDMRRFAGPLIAFFIAINLFSAVTQTYFRPAAADGSVFGPTRRW